MIHEWKMYRDILPLAQVLTFLPSLEQTKVISKALDGTIHIQTIGDPVKHARVSLIATREEMPAINNAEADGALVACVYRGTKYLGYISEAVSWEPVQPGFWYHTTFDLLIEEEVSV